MADKENTALANIGDVTFSLPVLVHPDEAREIMAENMGELGGVQFDRIKIPSGGGIAFAVIDENGEEDAVKELKGVIIDYHPVNAFWRDEFTGQNNPPDCSSLDGITGTVVNGDLTETHKCATCPHNQWGSDPKGGKGKACKNMMRVYLLREGSMFPVLLTLPPTSIGNWKHHVKRLTDKLKMYYSVVTSIKLAKDKNEGGIEYAKATFAKAAELTPQETKAIKEYRKTLQPLMRALPVDVGEYNTGDNGGLGGIEADGQPF